MYLLFVLGEIKQTGESKDNTVWVVLGGVSGVLGIIICRRQEAIKRQQEEYAAGYLNRVPPTVTLEPKAGAEYA